MKFLLDENLSPQLCQHLASTTDTVEHVYHTVGSGSTDEDIFDYAIDHESVIVTADTDFGTLLASSKTAQPSVILVRELLSLPVSEQGKLIAANLGQIREPLTAGAIVVFTETDMRVRPLPLT